MPSVESTNYEYFNLETARRLPSPYLENRFSLTKGYKLDLKSDMHYKAMEFESIRKHYKKHSVHRSTNPVP